MMRCVPNVMKQTLGENANIFAELGGNLRVKGVEVLVSNISLAVLLPIQFVEDVHPLWTNVSFFTLGLLQPPPIEDDILLREEILHQLIGTPDICRIFVPSTVLCESENHCKEPT